MKQKLSSYAKMLFSRLNSGLAAPATHQETIHELRVTIKRMRALIKLIDSFDKDKELKEPETLRHIFDAAGVLREIQVEQRWLSHLNFDEELAVKKYHSFLRRQEIKCRNRFKAALKNRNSSSIKAFRLDILNKLKKADKKNVFDYIHKQKEKVKKKLREKHSKPKHLHDLRKAIKTFLYVIESTEKDGRIRSKEKNMVPDLLKFQNQLGKWHDSRVARNHIAHFKDVTTGKTERVILNLEKRYLAVEEKLFEKAKSKAKAMLN